MFTILIACIQFSRSDILVTVSATPPWTALKEQKYGSLAKTSRVTTGSANSPPGFLLLTIMQPFRPFDSVEGSWRPVLSSVPVSVHVAQELES